jgi:hypothetical protein
VENSVSYAAFMIEEAVPKTMRGNQNKWPAIQVNLDAMNMKREGKIMKKTSIFSIVLCVALLSAISAGAEQSLLESVAKGCKTELDTYCKDVTPGEARVLACLYARSDKLSGKCEYAFYNAAAQLERAVGELSYVVNECADDLNQFCQKVPAGEGRLLKCIQENDPKVSSRCKEAMKQVGLR